MAKVWVSQNSLGSNQDIFMNTLDDFKRFIRELSRFGEVTVYGVSRHYTGMPKRSEYISVDTMNPEAVKETVRAWQDVFMLNPIAVIKKKPNLRYYEVAG